MSCLPFQLCTQIPPAPLPMQWDAPQPGCAVDPAVLSVLSNCCPGTIPPRELHGDWHSLGTQQVSAPRAGPCFPRRIQPRGRMWLLSEQVPWPWCTQLISISLLCFLSPLPPFSLSPSSALISIPSLLPSPFLPVPFPGYPLAQNDFHQFSCMPLPPSPQTPESITLPCACWYKELLITLINCPHPQPTWDFSHKWCLTFPLLCFAFSPEPTKPLPPCGHTIYTTGTNFTP